jgi:hypothetical protein
MDSDHDPLDVEQGGGPPIGTAWTLEITGEQPWSADLEHAAPLPRIGEAIELIRADGSRRFLRVRGVIHVVQPSATDRPPVRGETHGPNSTVDDPGASAGSRLLRAGLPRVVAVEVGADDLRPEG